LFPGLRRIDMLSHKLSPAGLLILKTLELLKKFKVQMLSTSDFMNVFVKKRLKSPVLKRQSNSAVRVYSYCGLQNDTLHVICSLLDYHVFWSEVAH
jgi:hypothetical protein